MVTMEPPLARPNPSLTWFPGLLCAVQAARDAQRAMEDALAAGKDEVMKVRAGQEGR